MSQEIDRSSAIAVVVMLVTWALPGVFVRFLPEMAVIELSAWRLIPAFIILALSLFIPVIRNSFRSIITQPIVWLAAVSMSAYYATSNVGLRNAPIAFIALLISLAPVWVMIFERLSGHKHTLKEISGAGIAFTGLLICLWSGLSGLDRSITTTGIWAGLISGILSAIFVLVMRQVQGKVRYQALVVSILTFALGIPMLILSWMIETPYGLLKLEADSLWYLAGLGFISTAMPTLCYAFLGTRLSATATSLMLLLVPPSAAIAGWFILNESLSWMVLSGGAISLLGVLLVITGYRKASSAKESVS